MPIHGRQAERGELSRQALCLNMIMRSDDPVCWRMPGDFLADAVENLRDQKTPVWVQGSHDGPLYGVPGRSEEQLVVRPYIVLRKDEDQIRGIVCAGTMTYRSTDGRNTTGRSPMLWQLHWGSRRSLSD